jgi:hypothetical protein
VTGTTNPEVNRGEYTEAGIVYTTEGGTELGIKLYSTITTDG